MYSHQIVDLFTPPIPGAIPDRGGHHNRLLITNIIDTYAFKWSIWMVTSAPKAQSHNRPHKLASIAHTKHAIMGAAGARDPYTTTHRLRHTHAAERLQRDRRRRW